MMECTWEKKQLQMEQSCKSRHTSSMCKAWGKDISKELSCYIPKYLINYEISHRLSSHLDLIPLSEITTPFTCFPLASLVSLMLLEHIMHVPPSGLCTRHFYCPQYSFLKYPPWTSLSASLGLCSKLPCQWVLHGFFPLTQVRRATVPELPL